MTTHRCIAFAFFLTGVPVVADTQMTIGDGTIDGGVLKPYQLTWQQCVLQDGQWQGRGSLTEELVPIGEHIFRHRQSTVQPDGTAVRSDTYFDRSSFAPIRMEMEASRDGARVAYQERILSSDGYTGFTIRGEERSPLEGIISSTMLHGGAMGLPLATIDYQEEPLEFLASMVGFDATYRVVADWVGKQMLEFEGEKIEAWLVDVEWHHRESGDVYPPGPDGSGGRYWLVNNPPPGYPYVPRYQTDTYSVAFGDDSCVPAAK